LDGSAAVVVRWDEGFDKLPECRPWVTRGFEDSRGDSLEPILAKFEGFAAIGGSASFPGSPHSEGLGGSGADDHNVDRSAPVLSIRENDVGTFEVVVVRWDHLFAVYGGVPPVVDDFMKRIRDGLVSLHGPSTVGAA
jgi:hypothetical protein